MPARLRRYLFHRTQEVKQQPQAHQNNARPLDHFLNRASEFNGLQLPQELNKPQLIRAMETVDSMSFSPKEREYCNGRKKIAT